MGNVKVKKVAGGLGRVVASDDGISGLICEGPSVLGGAELDTPYRLTSLDDLEALLIDEAYDDASELLIWHHVSDFFRMNPGGTLWFSLQSQLSFYADLAAGIDKLLNAAEGKIRLIGVVNGSKDADNTNTLTMQAACQNAATAAFADNRPVDFFIQSQKTITVTPTLTADDLRANNSENVSHVVAQDLGLVNTESTANPGTFPYTQYTLVGLALGLAASFPVNENIGHIRNGNVYGGDLVNAAIAGTAVSEFSETNLDYLTDRGYIFLRTYTGLAGLYFNDAPTSTLATSDFAYLENNRTIHKASRLIRSALLPDVNSPILVDPESGQISGEVAKAFELKGRRALDGMVSNQEVSAVTVFLDPEQNILSTSELVIEFELIPTGTARTITAKVGFTNPFNA